MKRPTCGMLVMSYADAQQACFMDRFLQLFGRFVRFRKETPDLVTPQSRSHSFVHFLLVWSKVTCPTVMRRPTPAGILPMPHRRAYSCAGSIPERRSNAARRSAR